MGLLFNQGRIAKRASRSLAAFFGEQAAFALLFLLWREFGLAATLFLIVAIVISGRPVLITDALPNADAWIAAWLPGTEGDGVADILFGNVHPTGKLSHSWRRDDTQANFMTCCNGNYQPLFPLGFGLTY